MKHILLCPDCKKYSMNEQCSCGGKSVSSKPPKYSPDDKYADLKREARKDLLKEKGLL